MNISEERFKKTIAVLIAVVTTLIAMITYLQSDAGARDDAANRDTKRYSLESFGRQVSGDARVNFDYNSAYQAYYELDLLAGSAANAGDEAAANRYATLRDQMTGLSPLLAPPYFDPQTGEVNIAKYEADTYVVETTALAERFVAASAVKDAWDTKANTYIVHLTLLAVALFLYGLSTTVSGSLTRWVFSGVGTVVALVATLWAVAVFLSPVPDLRECKTSDGRYAIDAYATGVGLAYQGDYEQAAAEFDLALACQSSYTNALNARAESQAALGSYEAAAASYEQARAAGDASASTAGELAWMYYLLGRFDDATKMNRTALAADPGLLWAHYDLALSLLATGKVDEAKAEYANGMNAAARQVADAKAAGQEPSSELWWSLEDAALSLDTLLFTLDTGEGNPTRDQIVNPDAAGAAATDLSSQLKSLSVALEYTGQPPTGTLAAAISPFTFAEPLYDEQANFTDYAVADTFEYGASAVAVLFDYDHMQDGQDVVFKVYVDGEEDPSWRLIDKWVLGTSGGAEKPLSFDYSYANVLRPGFYTVEMYVDSHLGQSGSFVIGDP